eukprot:TRINITY_DN169_c3_g1_i1.p1 TRINITY_DN169_c3_g1~~TRINITY_DN169_c3_g1_i1.p1  ORF type:complete len:355 (-),score=80.69 TRINITY_DN169_c3_g1_i1:161-1225(-)
MAHPHAGGPDPFLTHGQYGADGQKGHGAWEPAAEPGFGPEAGFYEGTPLKRPTGTQHTKSIAALVLVPWTFFVMVLFATALPPPGASWRVFTTCVYLAAQVGALICFATHFSGKIGPIYLFKGILICVGSTAALAIGSQIYQVEMANYWTHLAGVGYTNVPPTKPADAFQDANVLGFSRMSRVDLRNVLGFRPQGTVTTYCVAPILDATKKTKEVNFWAAGEDCCEPLRSFLCGDVQHARARSGLVFPPNASNFASERWHNFREAAMQAADLYGLTVPNRPIFVNWQQDAVAAQSGPLTKTVVELIMMSFIYIIVSMFFAAALHLGAPRAGSSLPMPQGGAAGGASGAFRTTLT